MKLEARKNWYSKLLTKFVPFGAISRPGIKNWVLSKRAFPCEKEWHVGILVSERGFKKKWGDMTSSVGDEVEKERDSRKD